VRMRVCKRACACAGGWMRCGTWTSSPYSKYFDGQSDDLRSPPKRWRCRQPRRPVHCYEAAERSARGNKQTNERTNKQTNKQKARTQINAPAREATTTPNDRARDVRRARLSLVHEVDRGGVHEHAPLVLRHKLVLARVRRQRCTDALPTRARRVLRSVQRGLRKTREAIAAGRKFNAMPCATRSARRGAT
jgi:hypothetical protein